MPAPQSHRLLIVDDDPSIHELVQAMLAGTDWKGDSASNSEEALARLQARSYDVLLADILMPGMDGLALLGRLRIQYAPQLSGPVNTTRSR
ncbi:MAG: response regulator [Bryobacteraceae bacterium]|jgi:CheY-like chemotaxis protein